MSLPPEIVCNGQGGGGPRVESVTCVIVSFRPELAQLRQLCEHILMDGAKVVVVDNTEAPGVNSSELPAACELIAVGYNSGIAHAQNLGVAHALTAGASIVVFFDQDSQIGPGFLPALVAPLNPGTPEITSPLYVEDVSNIPLPSLRIGRFGLPTAVHGAEATNPYPVDIVISSGTAATKEVFRISGIFDEGLFIDSVDSEWCLRCRSKQIPIYVVPAAVMRHRVGSRSIRLGRFTILQHNPTRCYYQLRNCFHMMRRKHVPFAFALRHMLSVLFSRTLLLWFVTDRRAYLEAYFAGLRDGIKGVTGAKPA
jgi:rhamnosyltransferase